MAILDTSDRGQIAAFAELEERRRVVLLHLEKTAESAAVTLQRYDDMVAAITPEGSIGSVWPDAVGDHDGYVAVFGASISKVLSALAAVVSAAWFGLCKKREKRQGWMCCLGCLGCLGGRG